MHHIRLLYRINIKCGLRTTSTDQERGNDWHAVSHLRDVRQKQSMSVNSAGGCVRAMAPADFLI